jgi:hypothetical protein
VILQASMVGWKRVVFSLVETAHFLSCTPPTFCPNLEIVTHGGAGVILHIVAAGEVRAEAAQDRVPYT